MLAASSHYATITPTPACGRLLDLSATALTEMGAYQRATTVEKRGARVGKVLAKYKMGKFIRWSIEADQTTPTSRTHRLVWSINADQVAQEKRFDGCYIITSDVDQEQMNTVEVVAAYKKFDLYGTGLS